MLYDEYLHQIRQQQERAGQGGHAPGSNGKCQCPGWAAPGCRATEDTLQKKESSFKIDFQSTADKFPKIFSVRQSGHETVNNKVFFHFPLEP